MADPSEFERWEVDAWALLDPLMAGLNMSKTVSSLGPEAMLAVSDQLHALSRDAEQWAPAHPCPQADLDVMFVKLARSYKELAELLGFEARRPGGADAPSIDREISGLSQMVEDTVRAMSDRPSD